MVPMRSVPHKVVCLVGLDDGIFPRTTTADGDDALARRPVTGERDTRAEDRQLLLDAVMAAQDTLVITYTGADEHSGAPRPPAVPLGELLDALGETATRQDESVPLVRRHPLQPYDVRNLGGRAQGYPPLLPDDEPFSFDPCALGGAEAALSRPAVTDSAAGAVWLVDEPLPDRLDTSREIDLEDLQRFLAQPAQAFLRQRLGLLLPDQPEEPVEGIPIELDGLEKWKIGDRMLRAVLAGAHPDDSRQQELWRGSVPPGELGQSVLRDIDERVRSLALASRPHLEGPARTLDLVVALPGGRRLTGTVQHVRGTPASALTVTYSTIRAKQRIRSWVIALALAAHGEPGATSHVIGQMKKGRNPGVMHLTHGPVDQETAVRLLAELVDVYNRGMRAPLPLGVQSSCAFAESFVERGDEKLAMTDAGRKWETTTGWYTSVGEQDDPAFRRVFGERARLVDIQGTPGPDELWVDDVRSRFGQLALRVWRPLLTSGLENREWA